MQPGRESARDAGRLLAPFDLILLAPFDLLLPQGATSRSIKNLLRKSLRLAETIAPPARISTFTCKGEATMLRKI